MNNHTVERLQAYLENVIDLNGIHPGVDPFVTASRNFVVAPSLQQVLIDKQMEDTSVLSRFNLVLVPEQQGEKIGLGISGATIASRTDTSGAGRRTTVDPHTLDNDAYFCFQTNFDTHLRYALLDYWAKFDDFEQRIGNFLVKAQSRDRLRVGFNGTAAAATTNRVANPMGQDVNIGWLQRMRLNAPANVMDEGANPAKVTYGAAGDYKTMDALVIDAVNSMIDPWYRNATDLVVMCSVNMLDDKYFPLVNAQRDPSEQIAADVILSSQRLGGRQAVAVPDFPDNTLFVTSFDNCSIYEQEGKRRRTFRDAAEKDAYEDFQSTNDAYVIEDYGKGVLIEKIEKKDV